MFGGLIAYAGRVEAMCDDRGGAKIVVRCEGVEREAPAAKDSIAIDGVCLTVTRVDGDALTFDVVPETLARSTLGDRVPGDRVNVEYALRAGERMGGHFVYGHVDAAARIIARVTEGQGARVRIARPSDLAFGLVPKAFVALDGVSLTVAAADVAWFEVALIPETLARTGLGQRAVGSRLNVEIDPLARYAYAAVVAQRGAVR